MKKPDANPTPATRNTEWGFWGAMQAHARTAWPLAMTAIAQATGCDPDAVRAFLDSRMGRHLADDVQSGLLQGQTLADAIDAAVQRWMGWTISRLTSKEYGIPRGMPYLIGFVVHYEIVEESLRS